MANAAALPEDPHPLTGMKLVTAAIFLALSNFMVVLDTTIANVSVPHIAGSLAVSPSQGTWVITSYSVAEAITVPLTGWLAARFGAVRVFAACLAGFGVFSALCGLAPTFDLLVVGRVAQGLCGGPLMPMSQTLLMFIFPKERRPAALGLWSMTVVVGPIVGPLLGGFISDDLHWSWIFLINVPLAAFACLWVLRNLTSHDTPTRRAPVDYVGLGLLVVWVGSMQIMLDRGKELDWFGSPLIVGLAAAAALGFVAFLIWELTSDNPIVDLRIFRHRGFTVAVVTLSLTFGSFFAMVVLLPLFLQTSMGYTATWAGYVACLNGVLAVVLSPVVARMLPRFDSRALISFGILIMTCVAFWRSTFTLEATFWQLALPQLIMGIAVPFFFVPTTSLTLSSVLPQETASAAGLQNFLRTTSAAFATSIMTTAWDNDATAKRTVLAGALPDPKAAMDAMTARGLSPEQALHQLDALVQQQATMLSTNQMFLTASLALALAASCIWLAPKPRRTVPGGAGGH